MKNAVKGFLQRLLGFKTYLNLFARYKVLTLKKDKNEMDFFKFMSLLPDRGLILDVGANIGIMTSHLLSTFQHAKIWAFEPMPDNLFTLRTITNKADQNRFRIFEQALGEKPGLIEMIMPKVGDARLQGLSHVLHPSISDFNEGTIFQVEMETLDRLVSKEEKVTGIKLDVENFEIFVLKGARELILRDKPVIYTELWENDNRQQCLAFYLD